MVRLPLPASGTDLLRHVDEQVQAGTLDAALDLSVVEFDELAQRAGVTVTGVETSAEHIAIHYTVAWTSFHACEDRRFGGRHARVLRGRAETGAWVFPPHAPWPTQRDAAGEL
ncbi:hypothetical protein ACG04Q_18850 [Roseateles sp. DXS20W]|uniref:Uncharacterized protein n=1 Tax=Pelomonas lactea TaxID=3299030 RepID=A0ABW7GNU4_9BURK